MVSASENVLSVAYVKFIYVLEMILPVKVLGLYASLVCVRLGATMSVRVCLRVLAKASTRGHVCA